MSSTGQQHDKGGCEASPPDLERNEPPLPCDDPKVENWPNYGYPMFSAWMASSPDFMILRQFGSLNARVMLALQDEIVRDERHLKRLDSDKAQYAEANPLDARIEDIDAARELALEDIARKLERYNKYLVTFAQIRSLPPAEKYQIENVENFFDLFPDAISKAEQEFIQHKTDVVSLVEDTKSPLRRRLEDIAPIFVSALWKPKHEIPNPTPGAHYRSSEAVEKFVSFFLVGSGFVLLFAPMWWLEFVRENVKRLGIITGFVFVFTAVLTWATNAKPWEVLAAIAGYTAVLVVYLQIEQD